MRRAAAVVLAIAGLISAAAPAAASAAPTIIVADLEGRPIAVTQIPDFYCHDRDYPRIRCFRSAEALERARAAVVPQATDGLAAPLTASATGDYVIVYALPGHAGSYTVLSQNYDALAFIGWNDRIQSVTGLNGASGEFYTDWYAGGYRLTFCCNAYVSSLSPTFNNAISSAYRM